MRIDNATQLELNQYFSKIDNYVKEKDVKKELEEALKRLPERERTIMVLYYHVTQMH